MQRSVLLSCLIIAATLIAGRGPLSAQTQQTQPPAAQPETQAGAQAAAPLFKAEELEQIAAPIALYPDTLLAQVMMASTYPLEIVHAARWLKEHPDVKREDLAKQLEGQTWDPSVKSLVSFPDVLTMMNDKLDWTQKLGDAVLGQRKELMDAIQRLRAKAKDAGNLKSGKEQTVKVESPPANAPTTQTQVIVIESSDPEVIYVPTYNPTVVYGAWPYPAYPPYYYYPPGYAAGAAFWSFSVGVVVGGAIWGNCNWGHNDVDIDINRYNEFNRNNVNVDRGQVGDGKWKHDPQHRQGVGYRDSATQQKYGRGGSAESVRAREDFRGRDFSSDLAAAGGGATQYRDLGGGARDSASASTRDSMGRQQSDLGASQSRDRSAGQSRSPSAASRDGGAAFRGVDDARSTRMHSDRGRASRGGGGRRR